MVKYKDKEWDVVDAMAFVKPRMDPEQSLEKKPEPEPVKRKQVKGALHRKPE